MSGLKHPGRFGSSGFGPSLCALRGIDLRGRDEQVRGLLSDKELARQLGSGAWTDITAALFQEEKERVRNRPALHDGTLWKEGNRQENILQERKTSRHAAPMKRVIVRIGMPVMIAIRLSAPFIKQGIANLGVSVDFSIRKRLEATQGSEFNFVVVAQNLTTPKAEDRITSLLFVAKGDFLHGLSAIPAKSIFTVWLKSQCFLLFPVFQVLVWQHFVRCNLQFRWSTKGLWHRKVGQRKSASAL